MKRNTLWSRNYTLLIFASGLGAVGGIMGSYAMRFLIFDETGSTLAAGLLTALQMLPHFLIPVVASPILDRMPRKPFLVWGDRISALFFAVAGLYLLHQSFSYGLYLIFSLLLNAINAFDNLTFQSIFPSAIPEGFEEKGYTVSAMLYPVLNVLTMPLAAVLMAKIGVPWILLVQSGFSFLASITENAMFLEEADRTEGEDTGFRLWLQDLKAGMRYLKGEPGLRNICAYNAVTNGASVGYGPILVAFFATAPGFNPGMYALFSGAEFMGRSLGGIYRWKSKLPEESRQGFVYGVQQFYNVMDLLLLWLPYPWMLLNRATCGFLGINSATVRQSAVQRYIPEEYRARVSAFSEAAICAGSAGASVLFGAIGEILDYRVTMSLTALGCVVLCGYFIGRPKEQIGKVYRVNREENNLDR